MYDAAAAEQRLIATSKYGSRLTVLAVGVKSSISIEITTQHLLLMTIMKWLLNVKTANVKLLQTFALRTGYQEDKSQDFKIINNQILINLFECSECGEYGEMYRELTRYAHTTYIRYCPPHFVEWQCPKHPDAKTIHIDEYVEDMSSNLRKIEI